MQKHGFSGFASAFELRVYNLRLCLTCQSSPLRGNRDQCLREANFHKNVDNTEVIHGEATGYF